MFVALGIHYAVRMRRVFIYDLPRSKIFSTLSHKWHDFRKKMLLNIKYLFRVSLQLLPETFFIIIRTERG